MLRALSFLVKMTLFSIVVLVLGNWLKWDGRTISDQIRTHLAHAESSDLPGRFKDWAGDLVADARKGAPKKNAAAPALTGRSSGDSDQISPSERQKLRALIRELNSSR